MREVAFFDWEMRPAIISRVPGKRGCWAVLVPGGDWVKADWDDVWDTAGVLPSEAAMRSMFDDWPLPPLPMDLGKVSQEEPLESSSE